MLRYATAALLVVACDSRPAIATCADDLHGVYATPSGRWMLLDNGKTLEAYPLFDDSVEGGAPRVIDLARGSATNRLAGELKRRFESRAEPCEGRAPVHVTRCAGNALEVVRGDVLGRLWSGVCSWGSKPSFVETWRRD
jgi:hypothetical protein